MFIRKFACLSVFCLFVCLFVVASSCIESHDQNMNVSCPLSHHHLCQGERTSSTAWPQVWHCCPHLGWKLRFWGHSMNPSLTVVVSPFRKSWWSRHTAKKSTDLVYWSIFREHDLMIKCQFALNRLSPQVRIFGVTVLVAAWWLDAAARGIPPTIPVVNFNTVIMMRGWSGWTSWWTRWW